jgi:AmmeMemoRadiSam system protein B
VKPKLREVEAHPIQHQGQQFVLLRDPLQLSDAQIAVPRPLAPLLGLMDGTRDETTLEAALQIRAGVRLAPGLLSKLLLDLDSAFLLDNERFAEAKREALRAYRDAPFRPLTVDGLNSGITPEATRAWLQSFVDALPPDEPVADAIPPQGPIVGLVSPHIDYDRGGAVYAQVWRAAAQAVREAELVIVFGTDHRGAAGTLALTRQSYATPWGVLPTDVQTVEALIAALGEEVALAAELHHGSEHSIELAAIWLHFIRGRPVPMVPILCGHFGGFIAGEADPADYRPFANTVEILRDAMASRRTLVVAAADLAHMGPAFGDPHGLDFIGRAKLRSADERLMAAVYAGDEVSFFEQLKAEGDRRNICGLPPIFLTLWLLGKTRGEPAGYAICPADAQGMSVVTVAGAILRDDG